MGFSADIALTKSRAISKLPSTATATAPCMSAWESLPKAIFPSGISTTHRSPALAAYAAAEADVLPVEAQITAPDPSSTGNTSASAAAYAAKAGLRCVVLIPEGKIALGKLSQALMHGAVAVAVDGNFDMALDFVKAISAENPITLVNSLNPYRIEGQKTAAFEVVEELGEAPDYLAIPVGNAGNITAYWQGFREYREAGKAEKLPVMWGFQASGANPLVRGETVQEPETVATAIRIGNPARGEEALKAAADSGGVIRDVSDDEILAAQGLLARKEGVFCEPASAAGVAGLLKHERGKLREDETVVVVLTGHGLKDPQAAIDQSSPIIHCPAELQAVERVVLEGQDV